MLLLNTRMGLVVMEELRGRGVEGARGAVPEGLAGDCEVAGWLGGCGHGGCVV